MFAYHPNCFLTWVHNLVIFSIWSGFLVSYILYTYMYISHGFIVPILFPWLLNILICLKYMYSLRYFANHKPFCKVFTVLTFQWNQIITCSTNLSCYYTIESLLFYELLICFLSTFHPNTLYTQAVAIEKHLATNEGI